VIFGDLTAAVGKTPMVELGRLGRGLLGRLVAKLEMRNPCGSVKDRLGVALIETMSRERVALLRHLGAEVVLTPGILMGDAIVRAEQLVRDIPDSIMLD
jgi:cysteine synthase A